MSKITPCLWCDGTALDAATFYTGLFPGSAIVEIGRYAEGMPLPAGTVMLVVFTVAGHAFQALNGGPQFRPTPSLSFFAHVDTPAEATRLFDALAEGGQVLMPLDAYPWSPRYAWVQDRFGVSWQIITGRRPESGATIVPCLMFAGAQHRQAEDALRHYAAIFPDAHVDALERYLPGEGPEDAVKHGRATLAGQDFVAMDSHIEHGFTFTEGVSLSVRCRDQAEVDHYWDALGSGGTPGPCGWLKDRFGVS